MLLRDGAYVALTPKAFETLAVLVESNGRIVDKEELLRLVWPGTCVEDATLAKTVSLLRKSLGEDEGHHYIDTVPKRGYRFAVVVRITDREVREERGTIHSDSAPAQPPAASTLQPAPANPPDPGAGQTARAASRFRWAMLALVLLVVAAATYVLSPLRTRSRTAASPSKAVPHPPPLPIGRWRRKRARVLQSAGASLGCLDDKPQAPIRAMKLRVKP